MNFSTIPNLPILLNYVRKMINLENVVWKEGQYFVAQCLNVDVSSFGETKDEALENLNEALTLYFEDNDKETFTIIQQPELVHTTFTYA